MSAQSALRHQEKILAAGGHHLQVMLNADAHKQLAELCAYHRLDRREVVSRLILGRPLSDRGGVGLSPSEVQAYEAMTGVTL